MSRHLYGIHDASADWAGIVRDFGMSGWAVISEEIGDDPTNYSGNDYNYLAAYGVTPIVRLNYSHHGQGTIPLATRYNAFAERCANFVTASAGCSHWIIANEPNLRAERYEDIPITPASYADCFGKCRNQILHRSTQHYVIPAAIAPYNADTGWCLDYWREMLSAIVMTDGGADGLALHTYSRGSNPTSITSENKMDAPYQNCYNGFRAYRNFLDLVPAIMRALPVYITETDQLEPWADTNSGWVQGAYAEINDWNGATGHQGIHCLALYRWENYDQWGFCQKHSVIDDFRNALTFGYEAPVPPWPQPPQPTPPTPAPEPAREIDPALYERGVTFDFAEPPAGTWYWRIIYAAWLEEAAAQVGPDHHILGEVLRDGVETAGVPLRVDWPSGDTTITSKADDPNATYNYDYAMSASLNEYDIFVADGNPSDIASGIGMGKDGNPKEHSSTWITFEWTISEGTIPPLPTPPGDVQAGYVTARAGLNVRSGPATSFPVLGTLAYGSTVLWDGSVFDWMHLPQGWVSGEYVEVGEAAAAEPASPGGGKLIWPVRGPVSQRWGENPSYYQQKLGIPYHNGTDIACAIGSDVMAAANATVTQAGDDPTGYGLFVEIFCPMQLLYVFTAHLSEILVDVGQPVEQGQVIALSGSTGMSTGNHCHVETRVGTPSGYALGTYDCGKGRCDPQAIMWAYGAAQEPEKA